MKGAVLFGPGDVRFVDRDNPKIIEPTDAIIRLSATCVCGHCARASAVPAEPQPTERVQSHVPERREVEPEFIGPHRRRAHPIREEHQLLPIDPMRHLAGRIRSRRMPRNRLGGAAGFDHTADSADRRTRSDR